MTKVKIYFTGSAYLDLDPSSKSDPIVVERAIDVAYNHPENLTDLFIEEVMKAEEED